MTSSIGIKNSLRNVQYQHLVEMLNFNLPEGPNRPVWKLFVMDTTGQKILAPLIKVNDLREHGVTLFLQLKGQRERVPNVPVVYFVEPSPESVALICRDLSNNLYDSYYLNFTSQISRDLLEELAQVALQNQSQLKIAKVYDQYLNYVTLEENLFTLEIPKLLTKILNFKESTSTSSCDGIVSGIFSVLMSFGCNAPVICTPQQGADGDFVRNVCGKLESKIRGHLINTKSALSLSDPQTSPNQPRPLLLIVDRKIDLAAPLKHSSAYNALIDEILGLNSNQVQISGGKTFDIDRRDWFWRENSTKSFPKVAESVESALKSYKTEYDRVLQTTPGMTEDLMKLDPINSTNNSNNTSNMLTPEQLKIAINVLPDLTERKRLIDTHLQISTALLESLKVRDLGTLFNIQQEIIQSVATNSTNSAHSVSPTAILTALKDPKIGNSQDKLRLLLIYIIYNYKALGNFIQEAMDVFKPTGEDLKALQSILRFLSIDIESSALNSSTSSTNQSKPNSPINPSNFSDLFSRISSTTSVLVSSVKNLIPSDGVVESPLTKFLDSAYMKVSGKQTNFPLEVIDPRPANKSNTSNHQANIYSIDHIILFVVGGAAYSEYDHLLEHFGRSKILQNLKFTLGVSEVLSPKKFLAQLAESEQ